MRSAAKGDFAIRRVRATDTVNTASSRKAADSDVRGPRSGSSGRALVRRLEWISGFERGDAEEGERAAFHVGHLELFRNYDDQGGRFARPRTLLINSRQIEAGDALDKGFRDAAGPEIEQFKRELAAREGAGSVQG